MLARHPCPKYRTPKPDFTCFSQSGTAPNSLTNQIENVKFVVLTSKLNQCPKSTPKISTNHRSAPQALTNQIEDVLSIFDQTSQLTNQIAKLKILVLYILESNLT